MRAFLDGLPAAVLDAETSEFRRLALAELRLDKPAQALQFASTLLLLRHRLASVSPFQGFGRLASVLRLERVGTGRLRRRA